MDNSAEYHLKPPNGLLLVESSEGFLSLRPFDWELTSGGGMRSNVLASKSKQE